MYTLNRAIDDFLGDCRRRRWSPRSVRSYGYTLNELADRLPNEIDVSKITVDDVRRYLATKSHLAAGTVATCEAHLASMFAWLYSDKKIAANPMERVQRTRRQPADELDILSIATTDVPRLLEAARPGTERNAVAIVSYLGPRRHAIALLRDSDYDRQAMTLRFREKGAKTIDKPIPGELAQVLDASIAAGHLWAAPHDYLVPPEQPPRRIGDRDDRVIWRVIKRVADRAGVDAHVHALRAAFACFYLEQPETRDDILGLKDLLGHRSLNTTLLYLRRRNKQVGMERVRGLSWAAGSEARNDAGRTPTWLVASPVMGAGGFEPPLETYPDTQAVGDQHDGLAPLSHRLNARSRSRSRADH
jgi:integrase